jgi:Protein of unknown function (DUF3159)
MTSEHMEIPDLRTVLRHAAPRFIEGTLIPLVLFLVFLRFVGVGGAMIAGLAWVYSLIIVRVCTRRRVPGILMLGALTLTARTVIAMLADSVVVYFLQPSLATMLIAAAFLFSVPLNRPLAGRLAADFCPLPHEMHANTHVRRFFRQISLLWAFAQTANAGLTIWLLFSQSLSTFVVARTILSPALTVTAIVVSALWFKRSMARNGIVVHLPSWRRAPA